MAACGAHESAKGDGLTASEIQRLGKALQNQEFRDLLLEYVRDISNPENQAQYEADVIAVERDRGYDVTFVRPEPYYVFKTTIGFRGGQHEGARKKAFVNVCQSDAIEKPSCKRVSPAIARSFSSQESEIMWTVPHSLTYPRDDTDKQQSKCIVYDCVYHPDTLRLAGSNKHFKKMVEEIAMDAVENSFGVQLDRTHVKYPKMKVKGAPVTTILRKKIEQSEMPLDKEKHVPKSGETIPDPPTKNPGDARPTVISGPKDIEPEYVIKHRHKHDLQDHVRAPVLAKQQVPSELVIDIKLPTIESASFISLDLAQDRLTLTSLPGLLPRYVLDLKLPYKVDSASGKAKFCTELRVLSVDLPVLGSHKSVDDNCMEDGSSISTIKGLSHQMATLEISDATAAEDPVTSVTDVIEEISDATAVKDPLTSVTDVIEEISDATAVKDPLTSVTDAIKELTVVDHGQMDLRYVLPEFSCHQSNDELIFVLKTSNVSKDSVRVECMEGGTKCRVTFFSVGMAACPFHYSLFLKFTTECRIVAGTEHVSVTEENAVIILAKHDESKHCWEEFDYGKDEKSATLHEVFALNALQRKLHVLQTESAASAEVLQTANETSPPIKITEVSSERFTFEIDDSDSGRQSPLVNGDSHIDDESDLSKPGNSENNFSSQIPNGEKSEDTGTEPANNNFDLPGMQGDIGIKGYCPAVRPLRKYRSLSESGDTRSPVHQPRGILKLHHRSRHLSESSDDACWSSQEYSNNFDLDILEEGSLENLFQARKSVHFNDKIYRSFFRSNSSILGQRQKNQRKERKKREALRRSSESECSEAEPDNVCAEKISLNKNVLNLNSNQKSNECLAAANAGFEETTTASNLDNGNIDGMNGNCKDAGSVRKTKKNKSRRRKKQATRKSSDSEGNSSSDGQQPFSNQPQRIGMQFSCIDVY